MGYDLTNDTGDELRFTGFGWTFYLNLAQRYGWVPAGTIAPPGHDGPSAGAYDVNAGQRVATDDAIKLADALERAVADPGRSDTEKALAAEIAESLHRHVGRAVAVDTPGDDGALLRQFAAFCRSGAFGIE